MFLAAVPSRKKESRRVLTRWKLGASTATKSRFSVPTTAFAVCATGATAATPGTASLLASELGCGLKALGVTRISEPTVNLASACFSAWYVPRKTARLTPKATARAREITPEAIAGERRVTPRTRVPATLDP